MKNRLFYGDNLAVLRGRDADGKPLIPDESIDLIYLDPPFNSAATYNVLFRAPDGVALPLPQFTGVDDRAADVLAFHREARPVLVRAGDDIAELHLSARGGWRLVTREGLVVELGRQDALPRLSRFARLLPTLRQDPAGRPLRTADLRYTNGFALSWGEPTRSVPPAAAPGDARATSPA